jgi:hypothetical protein
LHRDGERFPGFTASRWALKRFSRLHTGHYINLEATRHANRFKRPCMVPYDLL